MWRRSERRLPEGSGLLLVPAAAFAVHQLRYFIAYGTHAKAQLAAQGHSYLHSLAPWAVLALGIGATLLLKRAAQALRSGEGGPADRSLLVLWTGTAAGLVAIYTVQEGLESFLASGHPGGMSGIFGHGGYWAIPVAVAIAAVVVALLEVTPTVVEVLSHARPTLARLLPVPMSAPAGVAPVVVRPLTRSAAGRAPPRFAR